MGGKLYALGPIWHANGDAFESLLAWFGNNSDVAAEFHELGKIFLILLLVAHIIGGFFEQFVLGNPAIQRIIGAKLKK